MSDFDPNNPAIPTGDTIKIGVVNIFSGPSASIGELFWIIANWVTHDINKRGGIFVDGKRKKIQLIQGDTQGKPAVAKEVAERLCLEKKVHVLWGVPGSHLALAVQQVAGKYKVIFANCASMSDDLMNGKNFNRYTFRTFWNNNMAGYAMAHFLSQRKERRFYIFCPDYMGGYDMAEAFKQGLRKYKPNAEIVGEVYHPLWTKDFAPYLTKIKESGAEVIFTVDWGADAYNLLKQSQEMGVKIPFAHLYMDEANALYAVGPSSSAGLLHVSPFLMDSGGKWEHQTFIQHWNQQWKRWNKPYNAPSYKWPFGPPGKYLFPLYWLIDVIQRAGSTDPEKIIQTWEADEWKSLLGPLKMRACDHQAIMDLYASEYVYPNRWFEGCAAPGKIIKIQAKYVTPPVPEDLERCKK